MSNNGSKLRKNEKSPKRDSPTNVSSEEVPLRIFKNYVGKTRVKHREQSSLLLGTFTAHIPAKGFLIGLSPEPESEESIVAEVITLGESNKYKLLLDIANYGNTPTTVEVWGM